jgi:putative Mn2+ efflux pump MntP
LIVLAKALAVALAVGLDVLAVSVGTGIAPIARDARVRLGLAFSGSEIMMQVVDYALGAGAGRVLGEIAAYVGFLLLVVI